MGNLTSEKKGEEEWRTHLRRRRIRPFLRWWRIGEIFNAKYRRVIRIRREIEHYLDCLGYHGISPLFYPRALTLRHKMRNRKQIVTLIYRHEWNAASSISTISSLPLSPALSPLRKTTNTMSSCGSHDTICRPLPQNETMNRWNEGTNRIRTS